MSAEPMDDVPRGDVPMEEQGLAVSGLHVRVGDREILKGVDLRVRPGEVHAVMGPNGSGKSTLASALAGKPGYKVTAGSIRLDGRDLTVLAPWERARAGLHLAPQYPTEVPGVSLTSVLGAGGEGAGAADRIGAEAERVGLPVGLLDRPVNVDMSGGEKKRNETLQLAVLRRSIAILDELDSGLDVDALRAVAGRIEAATEEWGLGVVAITHYTRLLDVLTPDVVHVFSDGRMLETGGADLAERVQAEGYAPWIAAESSGAESSEADPLGLGMFP